MKRRAGAGPLPRVGGACGSYGGFLNEDVGNWGKCFHVSKLNWKIAYYIDHIM